MCFFLRGGRSDCSSARLELYCNYGEVGMRDEWNGSFNKVIFINFLYYGTLENGEDYVKCVS